MTSAKKKVQAATPKKSAALKYKRVLLKLSGEALGGTKEGGVDFKFLAHLAKMIKSLKQAGVEIAIVLGGGNFWRYRDFKDANMDRVNSDYVGMIATIINSMALQDELRAQGQPAKVYSALYIEEMVENFVAEKARNSMENGEVVICAGGTGNPFCTTDSAAALRAAELNCQLIVKATNVDYVYDKDPHKFKNAKPFKTISYDQVLSQKLGVMDLSAIATAMEARIPIAILNLNKPENMLEILRGKNIGTIINI